MADRPSGMEIMVRSLMKATGTDPDEVFAMIKHLIDSGTLTKIIRFADDLPKIVERLDAIERRLIGDAPGEPVRQPGDVVPRLVNGHSDPAPARGTDQSDGDEPCRMI